MHLLEGYGSTEAGAVFVDGEIRRPPVIDYKLVDVPELGYFGTDRPHPRGELLVKSEQLFPGYYKRPEVTAEVFDADGYYRTGDIVAETRPRPGAVRRPAQQRAQAVAGRVRHRRPSWRRRSATARWCARSTSTATAPGPTCWPSSCPPKTRWPRHDAERAQAGASPSRCKECGRAGGPAVLRDPARLHHRDNAFHAGERPADRHPQAGVAAAQGALRRASSSSSTPTWPTVRPTSCAQLRQSGADAPVLETVSRAASALLGAAASDCQPDAHFTDLGGDSLSALTFANLLHEIFDVDVPVGVIVSPASDLAAIAAYIEAERQAAAKRPTYAAVHGRDATEVHASDLTLDKFLDAATLAAAPSLPRSELARSAPCCSPAQPASSAATWPWSGWSGWTWSTAR